MNAARRSKRRRDWPPYLYEPRPGYFVWRDPRTGASLALGAIPFPAARHQALEANAWLEGQKPSLLDRLTGATKTIGDLLDQMPVAENKNTAKSNRSMDKLLRAQLGMRAAGDLTVAHCAEVVEALGAARWAQAVRSRLVAVCRRGQQLGWMESNPAQVTANPKVIVQRERLTLEAYLAILARAGDVAEWLPLAMRLALLTGMDRSTIAGLQRRQIDGKRLVYLRSKIAAKRPQPVAIPLELRLEAVGWSLADVLAERPRVLSPYVVHHVRPWGNAPAGAPVAVDRFSHAFAEARDLAGFGGSENPPTFHEIRSLAKRLYKAQGNVDTKALFSHADDKMDELYNDPRGVEPLEVKIR